MAVRPSIERVLVWNRTHARAVELAHRMTNGIEVTAIASIDEALPRPTSSPA